MDDINRFAKSEKELEILIQTIKIFSQDIGMEFGIEKRAMLIIKSGKSKIIEGIKTLAKKEKLQVSRQYGNGHNQTSGDERKK